MFKHDPNFCWVIFDECSYTNDESLLSNAYRDLYLQNKIYEIRLDSPFS